MIPIKMRIIEIPPDDQANLEKIFQLKVQEIVDNEKPISSYYYNIDNKYILGVISEFPRWKKEIYPYDGFIQCQPFLLEHGQLDYNAELKLIREKLKDISNSIIQGFVINFNVPRHFIIKIIFKRSMDSKDLNNEFKDIESNIVHILIKINKVEYITYEFFEGGLENNPLKEYDIWIEKTW